MLSHSAYSLVQQSAHQPFCQQDQVLQAQAIACHPGPAQIECLSQQQDEKAHDAHLLVLMICARVEKLGQCLELLVHQVCQVKSNRLQLESM